MFVARVSQNVRVPRLPTTWSRHLHEKMEGARAVNFRPRGQIQKGIVPKGCRVNRVKDLFDF